MMKRNPLTPTLSPQRRGEGGRDSQRAINFAITNPSCDAGENPLTPALSPQGRGEGGRMTRLEESV